MYCQLCLFTFLPVFLPVLPKLVLPGQQRVAAVAERNYVSSIVVGWLVGGDHRSMGTIQNGIDSSKIQWTLGRTWSMYFLAGYCSLFLTVRSGSRKGKGEGGRRMRGHKSKKAKDKIHHLWRKNRAVETLAAFFRACFSIVPGGTHLTCKNIFNQYGYVPYTCS